MTIISLIEVIELLILVVVLGYIFSGIFKRRPESTKELYKQKFTWADFKLAMLVTAPAVVFHEMGHKFVAILLGINATFHNLYWGLAIGVVLKLIASPIIIFAPGYVEIPPATPENLIWIIAIAGPLVNLILFVGATIALKTMKLSKKTAVILYLTKIINIWLFIFNMLPIPPLDGSKVYPGLYHILVG